MLKKINYKDYTNYLVDEYGNVYSLPHLVTKSKGNPRARKVKNLTDGLVFDTIGECAEWLISNNYTSGGIDNARSEISKACKTHKKYLSKEFKFV